MNNEDIQYEVHVTNAYKNYGENNVFNGLNMKVTSGSIYGLLGPSGCGKSTLLQCILGTITLDSGTIDLKIRSLKNVGYMPQDLCLEEMLTINETFEYYGTLYKMNKKTIETKKDELRTFLQLPNMESYIQNLSGGQSRRVSLAISLLHDPKLIILDEPTVGIDPILRQVIWTEFTKMVVQNQKTIIITTHYIEEASQANCIGLMRSGVIIEEGSPQDILIKYDTDSLESAFLTLCYNQENNKNYADKSVSAKEVLQTKKLAQLENNFDFQRIRALFKKNFHICSRDYMLLFVLILLPIVQSFNFCLAIGNNFKNMPISFKNDEVNYKFCQNYSNKGCIFDKNFNETMSCIILDYFASLNYKLIEVKDREAGEMTMNNRDNLAFIHFQKNYTKDFIKYMNRDKDVAEFSIYIHLSNENFLFKNQIRKDVFKSFTHLLNTTLNNCNTNPKTLNFPMEFHTILGNDVKTFGNGIASLVIEMGLFYLPSVYGLSVMLSEKMDGVLSRSMISGVKLMELLTSLFCICTIILVVEMFLMCFIIYVMFTNPILTSGLFLYVFVMIISGWMGFFSGILAAVLSPTKLGGTYVITGLSMSQFILSGALWPLEGQPEFLRIVSRLTPMRLVGNMMNDIALKGWSLNHPAIIMSFSTALLYIVLLVLILIVLGKFKKHWWVIQK